VRLLRSSSTLSASGMRHYRTLAGLVAGMLALVGCGGNTPDQATTISRGPLTVENCGEQVTINEPPQRVVILGSSPIPLVEAAGVLNRVVAKAGEFPDALYTDKTRSALNAIPTIGEGENASGGVQIAQEVVIAQQPDLVIGYETETITRSGLAEAGIPLLILPAFCSRPEQQPANVGLDNVYEQVEFYGRVFGTEKEAAASIANLRDRVAAVEKSSDSSTAGTAATLFLQLGGGTINAYGQRSIAHAQMEKMGFTNVFGDTDKRNFEVTTEELLARDPQALIILHIEGQPEEFVSVLKALPGADRLTAVKNNNILVMLFGFTDPPTPLSINGLEKIADRFG
jgi:iron complex transport system substrate-binding protein